MAGKKRLIIGDITLSKLRGPALIKALGQMNSEEKGSSYQNKEVKK